MRRYILSVWAGVLVLGAQAGAEDKLPDDTLKKMEDIVEKSMKGYNEEDAKVFWEG